MIHEVWAFGQYCLPKVSNGLNAFSLILLGNHLLGLNCGKTSNQTLPNKSDHKILILLMNTLPEDWFDHAADW